LKPEWIRRRSTREKNACDDDIDDEDGNNKYT
jgi:hypothetical protein